MSFVEFIVYVMFHSQFFKNGNKMKLQILIHYIYNLFILYYI